MTWKRLLLLGLVLAGLGAGATWFWADRTTIEVLTVPGVVEIQEVRVGSKVGGRVEAIEVEEGEVVEPGQLLVRFQVPELEAQKAQWEARLAEGNALLEMARNGPRSEELTEARALVDAAKSRLERVRNGPREQEIRQAKSELEAARADEALAKQTFDRLSRLFAMNTSSRDEYNTARFSLDRSRGSLAAAQAQVDLLEEGSRAEDIQEATASLAAAEARLALLEAGTRVEEIAANQARVAETEAKLRELEANLSEAQVLALDKAVVDVVAVRPGDLVPPGTSVVRLLRARDLWVKVYVPETELGKLRLNQTVRVSVDAYPGMKFEGRVMHIAAVAEFTPRNVQSLEGRRSQVFGVKVYVDDARGIFKSGMAAVVEVGLHRAEGGGSR